MGSLAEMMSGGILLAFPCDDPESLQGFLKNFPAPLTQMQFAVDGNVLLYGAELRIKAALKKGRALSDGL
ncbi:hypothetical protein FF011L_21570 [Roseimaritima multifibrata]|uniref:Uncharacterized protein n=1 Tax=Roseimaritima multifibrata TaxID=1930274 RepID=A0A517MES5_9BACT|nr:hypothetical protein [Roseimaritima multifibrata]QDS93391.1 hypothetical protein FF011L_21570 [Roseimaritima multifibrata]